MAAKPFAEDLPELCPPEDCSSDAVSEVFRLLKVENPTESDFASKAALNMPRPANTCECKWASCSLFKDVEIPLAIKGLRRRHPYVATLSIPEGSGMHIANDEHVDFWRFSDYNLTAAVQAVWKHNR